MKNEVKKVSCLTQVPAESLLRSFHVSSNKIQWWHNFITFPITTIIKTFKLNVETYSSGLYQTWEYASTVLRQVHSRMLIS